MACITLLEAGYNMLIPHYSMQCLLLIALTYFLLWNICLRKHDTRWLECAGERNKEARKQGKNIITGKTQICILLDNNTNMLAMKPRGNLNKRNLGMC
jgi:hypothetical protein